MRILLLFSIICLCLFSCNKKNTVDLDSFFDCNASQHLDSAAISNKLAGSWFFSMRFCGSGGSALGIPINVKANFDANSSFTLTDHYGILTQGNWKLKIVDTNLWGLDLTSQSDFLYGRILFCENNVMFNNSYRDGCDNVFYK